MQAQERIILALDVGSREQALALVKDLAPHVGAFKVGMQLFNSCGPSIVEEINQLGGRVFLDLKFHDIPNTVAAAGRVITRLNCFMFNVHAAGGREMMRQVVEEVKNEAKKLAVAAPLSLAVTVLTSISQEQLEEEIGVKGMKLKDLVVKWALMAKECGISGVVSSPQEIEAIRAACGPEFKIVTPGIRPAWSEKNDQKRITTPGQALQMGADFMVIGRPITQAANPVEAALKIIGELEE
ncbi:orotidine-5'-phosphate decarboxylase [Syntrophomonas wolfei]|uniref:Orotidine 5'-phosphate decarboxylase n=1 Tax=Syntrophomonas wolfei subsp. wolfei (strain DSM 2245B / Goettingen) TaxID=335541 RepID=PYRF_SYNWW|nr:orotidine-5'-phosphate decarboxylase [Syntrophomonas wolfei]Q0AXG7.1 RecName: Full=Orotidine 5'-phosphate decarboxylase; AltName: Full=OMP decarboxylase; Short=OMPDCase; Short=OMPdecase [Syntrophomonas wolfei subsp. wolfei str. Goettingen G311]ABI68587.1 orotidine-5'-phosphate decarboxylase [Syntrophomonas wolfei subsp. wolfei str. Goettingen G311]